MKLPTTLAPLLFGMLSIAAGPVLAATGEGTVIEPGHAGQHTARQDAHAGHGASHDGHMMAPAAVQGAWSYLDRDNPKPHTSDRWEMMPAPDHKFLFQSAADLSAPDWCALLLRNPHIMVDRATRAACTQADSVPPSPHAHETARLTSHEGHQHE